jgi:hypothetical protein
VGIFDADTLLHEFTPCIVPHSCEYENTVVRFQRLEFLHGPRLLYSLPVPHRVEIPKLLKLVIDRS